MFGTTQTEKLIQTYADRESWIEDHRDAMKCYELEDMIASGVMLMANLTTLDENLQQAVMDDKDELAEEILGKMPGLYRRIVKASEFYLGVAESFIRKGYSVARIGEFRAALEEARCIADSLEFEQHIRPIEELIPLARPGNPDPSRYGE
jgi:hypothetical protein